MAKEKVEYKIERGIEIPPKTYKSRGSKYPWGELKKRLDSFFVPVEGSGLTLKGLGRKNTTARVVAGGVRVWRVG